MMGYLVGPPETKQYPIGGDSLKYVYCICIQKDCLIKTSNQALPMKIVTAIKKNFKP
jgi:hypothetical protein